ncbi:FG-GAP-like repeat-containing protein [Geminocystis herdmanii]|uniref:FG-GAP-like repeat-containing protein n=1 Tax=Geminocystis herdmanii TaxID=669359 RepID=UPI000348F215|nr:FG-GAP-like repeat-containing protein [Geminocystis herdmanii]
MDNLYGANAAIEVSADGVEHAVWVQNGQLWHGIFDDDTNQWNNAKSITPISGENLKLLTGRFIPYQDANGATRYAPGLVAVCELGNSLFAVIGKYNNQGKIEWSETVPITLPEIDEEGNRINHQNLDIALTPETIASGGRQRPPGILIAFQKIQADNPEADTDIYSQVFNLQLRNNQLELVTQGKNNQTVTFQTQEAVAPVYEPLPPTIQAVATAGRINTETAGIIPDLENTELSLIKNTPLGGGTSFSLNLNDFVKLFGGSLSLPSFLPGSNPDLALRGKIEGTESYNFQTKATEYVISTSFGVGSGGQNDNKTKNLNNNSQIKNLVDKATVGTANKPIELLSASVQNTFGFDVSFDLKFDQQLKYTGFDFIVAMEYGTVYAIKYNVPPAGIGTGSIISATVTITNPNYSLSFDLAWENKGKALTPPLFLEKDKDGNIVIKNTSVQGSKLAEVLSKYSEFNNILKFANEGSDKLPSSLFKFDRTDGSRAIQLTYLSDAIVSTLSTILYSYGFGETATTLFGDISNYRFQGATIKVGAELALSGQGSAMFNTFNASVEGRGKFEGGIEWKVQPSTEISLIANLLASAKLSGKIGAWQPEWSASYGASLKVPLKSSNPRVTQAGEVTATEEELATLDDNNNELTFTYNPPTGDDSLYSGTPVATKAEQIKPDKFEDLVNDSPPALAFSDSGDVLLAWVADGRESNISLESQTDVVSRVMVSTFDSGGGWQNIGALNVENGNLIQGFNFEPTVLFFYTNTRTQTPVKSDLVDFDSGNYTINRMVVWSYGQDGKNLTPESSSDDVREALLSTDLVYSLSSRSVVTGSRWSNWSTPQVIVSNRGVDRTPTLGLDPNGALRLAWVNDQTERSTLYTTTWDGKKWNSVQTVAQGNDLDVEKIIVENFGNQPALYWTDSIELNYSSAVLADNPLYYYRLNESEQDFASNLGTKGVSGNGSYANPSRKNNSLPFRFGQQGALFNTRNSKGDRDSAVKFLGGGYLAIPVSGEDFQNGYSFESWLKFDSLTGEMIIAQSQILGQYVLGLSDDTTAQQYNIPKGVLYLLDPNNQGVLNYQIGGKTLSSNALQTNRWYHVVATYQHNRVDAQNNPITPVASLYIDNQLVKQEQVDNVDFTDGAVKIGQNLRSSIAQRRFTIDDTQGRLLADFAQSTNPSQRFTITQVVSGGDVDGDGFADVIILNSNNEAYVSFGVNTATRSPSSPILLGSGSSLPTARYAIASGGDLNNDGYSDVILGNSTNNNNNGRVNIVYGNSQRRNFLNATLNPPITLGLDTLRYQENFLPSNNNFSPFSVTTFNGELNLFSRQQEFGGIVRLFM